MFDPKAFDDLVQRLSAALPIDTQVLSQDIEKNVKAVLQTGLHKLNLVTREEFDVQREVLSHTRIKVEGLEKRIAELETQMNVDR